MENERARTGLFAPVLGHNHQRAEIVHECGCFPRTYAQTGQPSLQLRHIPIAFRPRSNCARKAW